MSSEYSGSLAQKILFDPITLDSVDTSLCKHICPQRYAPDLNSSDKG